MLYNPPSRKATLRKSGTPHSQNVACFVANQSPRPAISACLSRAQLRTRPIYFPRRRVLVINPPTPNYSVDPKLRRFRGFIFCGQRSRMADPSKTWTTTNIETDGSLFFIKRNKNKTSRARASIVNKAQERRKSIFALSVKAEKLKARGN